MSSGEATNWVRKDREISPEASVMEQPHWLSKSQATIDNSTGFSQDDTAIIDIGGMRWLQQVLRHPVAMPMLCECVCVFPKPNSHSQVRK